MASVSKRKWTHKGVASEAWVVRYVDRAGKQRSKQFDRKKDADNYRTKVEHEKAERGHIGYVEVKSVAEIAKAYGAHVDRRLEDAQIKRGTHKNIVQALRTSILPRLGKMRIEDVTADLCEQWFTAIRSEDGLAAKTAQERLVKLGAMFDFAMRRKFARSNPAREALANIGGIKAKKIRILSRDEIAAILRAAQKRRPGQHRSTWLMANCAINLAAFSGLRCGEILALRLADIDLERRVVHVRHTINAWDELTSPKTESSRRTVPIPAHVASMLRDWIREYYVPNDRTLVFRAWRTQNGKRGGAISISNFNSGYWRPVTAAAGMDRPDDHIHFHALRHFAASWWLKNQMPIPEVSELMGHASPQVTLSIYAHAMADDRERGAAVETMAQAFMGSHSAQELRNGQFLLENQAA
jgi:integrase